MLKELGRSSLCDSERIETHVQAVDNKDKKYEV